MLNVTMSEKDTSTFPIHTPSLGVSFYPVKPNHWLQKDIVRLESFPLLRLAVKWYAEEHQPGISISNKNIFSLLFRRNKNIDFDLEKPSKNHLKFSLY